MRRLIYAPKVYIFIRSSNMNGTVYDVTADVTSGSVTQNLNDLSKAQFTLRNRYRKWIRDKDSGLQIFLPMDMVTIWLQRVAGRPIQVFTGFLDSVPYYQAYPGDAIFEASCTLKKLAFSWFDPGLPFFQQWVMSNDGWVITPDGEAYNPAYLTPDQALVPGSPLSASSGTTATVNDGGFDALLGRFLVEVAGWSVDDVLISDLPKDLPKLAARLYADVNKSATQDLQVLETALGQVMGLNGWTNSDPNTPTTSNNSPAQTPAVIQVLSTIKKQCDQDSIPLLACAFAGYVTTNLDATFEFNSKDPKSGVITTLYGLYGLTSNGQTSLLGGPIGTLPGTGTPTIDGTPVSDIVGDATTATAIFCKRMNQHPDLVKAVKQSPTLSTIQPLVEAALGRSLNSYKIDLQSAFNTVKQYCAAAVVTTTPSSQPASQTDPGQLTWSDPKVQKLLTDQEKQVVRDHYQKTKPWLAGVVWRAKQVSSKITIVRPLGKIGFTSVSLYGPASALASFYGTLVDDPSIDKVDAVIDGRHYLLQNGVESNLYNTTQNNNTLVVTQNEAPTSTTTPSNSGSNDQTGGAAISSLVTLSANAAFAAQFAFPANYIQSISLTGNRALMNDVSCLDGAKQFCQASLRTFRSLPDGRFLAFYPDYFGATRKPYWQIYNIEITNFGIQLNDQALATHVYVVGDTFGGDGQIDWHDQVSTRGVATITQAFMLNSFIEPYQKTDPKAPLVQPLLGRLKDAYSFLQQYGARPHEEDQPLIRNVFYEFLLAWQRFMQLWASQFATECTFTFQPEVMAGGLIAFPDHSIQMFCESVTHSWDYTNGFETQATLTAPSLLANRRGNDHLQWPGFALAGNVNTVGS